MGYSEKLTSVVEAGRSWVDAAVGGNVGLTRAELWTNVIPTVSLALSIVVFGRQQISEQEQAKQALINEARNVVTEVKSESTLRITNYTESAVTQVELRVDRPGRLFHYTVEQPVGPCHFADVYPKTRHQSLDLRDVATSFSLKGHTFVRPIGNTDVQLGPYSEKPPEESVIQKFWRARPWHSPWVAFPQPDEIISLDEPKTNLYEGESVQIRQWCGSKE